MKTIKNNKNSWITLLDSENAKEYRIEWLLSFGSEPFRAMVNKCKEVEYWRSKSMGWIISAGIIGFILGFLLGSYEPAR